MKNNNLKINTLGKMSLVKQSIITAVCIALCVVFPMLVELTCYALISSLLMKFVHTKKSALDLYISLVGALVIGRVIAGIVKALIFARGEITIASWATAYFVTCLPGIIMQIILVPVVFATLTKANLIPSRYVICEE